MEKVNYILNMDMLEEEIEELKIAVHGDTLSQHRIINEGDYTIIELFTEDKLTSEKDLFYGKQFKNLLCIGRHQHVAAIEYDPIDLYDEFIGTGEELSFA
ncbi:hypothetical protein [Heyndrickxia camelliae]|uniref:Uncharacterized protein n=1 Tax=Heyndrickxia camelliae TaxID=1707093 RepID=A0A2N3LE46_9BACI|nr:hypothetical protein [Heyndrickxia camelliae]PKR82886.1 hypothetical protein CWO92_22105 [Heyndrickxia camelliae]